MFENRIALVTGGASGIGRAAAQLYAQHGATVVVSDIDETGAQQTVETIGRHGGKAEFAAVDVSDPATVEKLIAAIVDRYGRLDIAFNNAGVGGDLKPLGKLPLEEWHRVLDINLSGIFYCMRYEIPVMLTQETGGVIVNTASILGQVGSGMLPAYVAAKHGVIGLTQDAALAYSAKGLRINCIGPGYIATPMMETQHETVKQASIRMHPIGRKGQPEEVAELVIWLSSDKASFATGGFYPIDGGYLAR